MNYIKGIKSMQWTYLSIAILVLSLVGCQSKKQEYSDSRLWYNDANTSGPKSYDIFYVLPTCVWDRIDANGDTLHFAEPFYEDNRKAMKPSFELAEQIFGSEANFYAPYYHQASLESWSNDSLVNARFSRSFSDIKQAFDYYINNINEGRPFVLAGFSQGAKCVVELLKTLNDEQYQKLVAAYVIGYKVTASDTLNYMQIKPAKNEKDIGVTICYNSVANTDAICPILSPGAICINPVNWATDTTQASLNDTVSVHIDHQRNVLIVDGFDTNKYYNPVVSFLFEKGNFHLQELFFYRDFLSNNVKTRQKAYMEQKRPNIR